jgi:MoxR-like ATPase
MSTPPDDTAAFRLATERLGALCATLEGVVVGQRALVRDVVTAVFAGGHVLIEGLPGLGKTHLAKALAAALGLSHARVQCTPDLMPADVVGSEVLGALHEGAQSFAFRPGPVFTQLLLVDEINRATPRTQSALLEAMQELQVTNAGVSRPLPRPFCVLATQNPIELEGTYPLPEAQLDRFTFKLRVPYPDREALRALLDVALDGEPAAQVTPLIDSGEVLALQALCREVLLAERCKQAAIALVLATQPAREGPAAHLRYGASPRALQALLRAARVRAVLDGRTHVDVADIDSVALPVLRHRVLLRLESELDGGEADSVLADILGRWRATA